MNTLLAGMARLFIAILQSLPLRWVARLGRAAGAIAFLLDRRHRRVALSNLERVFGGEMDAHQRHAIARENFRRLGENYACAVKTASMSREQLDRHLEWTGLDDRITAETRCIVGVVGHFANFEVYARIKDRLPGWTIGTTYRALRQPALNRLLLDLRERSGVRFFERRSGAEPLRRAMQEGRMMLSFLSDQHGGDRGLWLPFLGHPCSCNTAAALMAVRYHAALRSAVCYRTGLARWRVEIEPEIPTRDASGNARPIREIQREINGRLEAAIRRDPANWFWVHRRWKPPSAWQQIQMSAPEAPLPNPD